MLVFFKLVKTKCTIWAELKVEQRKVFVSGFSSITLKKRTLKISRWIFNEVKSLKLTIICQGKVSIQCSAFERGLG